MKRIEGGQDGIQYISKGSQQFATEGNFLFMSTNDAKQSFHVKTGGGILLENKKNKVHLQENGARLDLLYLEENILGDFTAAIGGNYWLQMTDKKGQMRFTDFHKYQIVGDTFEIDVAKFLVKRGDYGIDWENDLIVSNPSQIKFMSLNGDINFSTKNGERIIFENEKPNGVIEFKGERSLIKTGLAKMEHQTLQITCPNIRINRKFIIEDDGLEVQMDAIQLQGAKMEIGCIKMREGNFRVRADELQLGAGEDTKIEITRDKISLIGEGNLGIMLIGGKGGIKMLGDLQWIHMENVLIQTGYQTDSDQKILRIGAESWKLRLEGDVEIENCTLIGKNRRVSGELCEIFGDSSVSWHIGDKMGKISAGGIIFESGVNRLEILSDCIREIGVKKRIEFGIIEEIGINKSINWDKLEEKGEVKNSEWGLLEYRGTQKKENWESADEEILNYSGLIRGKYELGFEERGGDGIYWDSGEFEIRGVFKKNDRHTIFGGDNKLIIENAEIEIRNCLRWKDNELLIGIGRRVNNIFLTEGVMLLGGKEHHLTILEDKIDIGGSIFVNSQKQVFIGDTMGGIGDSKEKKIVIGLESSSLLLDEKQVHLRGKKVYLSGGESMQINGKNVRIQGGAIGIGSSETGCIEFVGEKMVYKNGGSQMEWGDDFLYTREGGGGGGSGGSGTSRFYVGEKGVIVDSDDVNFKWGVHTKAPIDLYSSAGNISIESIVGDIQIKNDGGQIFMSKEDKILGIWSEGNIWAKGKKIMMEAEKIEVNGKNIGVDCKMDVDIRFGRKLEALGGKEIEFQCREGLKLASELFGELKIGAESEFNVQKSLDMKIGENYGLNVGGSFDFTVEKDLNIRGKKMLEIGAEDGVKLVSEGAISLEGRERITMKSANFGLDVSEGLELLAADRLSIGAKQMLFQQRGFGEMSWEADGKIRMVSKIEGTRGDVMEIRAESNTHEKSIYLCSKIGGIYLEGQTIGLGGGKVNMNGLEIVGGENRLLISGMVEASGLKIGKNMFIEPRGISLLQREELELRNMDIKLGGRLDAESLRVKKILGGAEVEGKMRVIGGIETKGGIVGDGVRLGNWDGGNRSCLKIDMKGTVWNEGVNISGGGRSIVVDGDIVCGGGGRILAHSQREGREGGGGRDIGKLLEEVAAMGDSGVWDVGRALHKLTAIVGILVAEKEE
jgi:hypothetical protein